MQYEFTRTIIADTPKGEARTFTGGEVIDATEIAAGCLESCLRQGVMVPHVKAEVQAPPSVPDPEPAKGKKK